MKRFMFFCAVVLLMVTAPCTVRAGEEEAEQDLLNRIAGFDYSGIEREASNDPNIPEDLSFSGIITAAIKGELDLNPSILISKILQMLFKEIYDIGSLMKNLIIIAILSAVINSLAQTNKKNGIGELGFYVTYITLIGVLFTSFCVAAGIVSDMVSSISKIMQASIPLTVSLLFMTGNVTGAYTHQALLMFAVNFITSIIVNLVVPVIILGAAIKIINYITEKDILTNFADLIKKGCSWILKGLAGLFVAVLSLQRISTPILSNLAVKTAKLAVNAVPVVGGALSGAVDSVTAWVGAAKSGISIALIILVIAACALPTLKLVALVIVYKLTAAIIQPVCDPRIVKCIDAIGTYSVLLLGAGVSVTVMFVFSVMVLLSF